MKKQTFISGLVCLLAFQILDSAPDDHDAPDLIAFEFAKESSRILPGSSAEKNRGHGCNGVIKPVDQIGPLAIVSQFYQNACYMGDTYSAKDFKVDRGALQSKSSKFDAYRVHPPASAPKKFLGSRHVVHYKFPKQENHLVYKFDDGALFQVAKVDARRMRPGQFTKIPELVTSTLARPAIFVFVPASARVSPFTEFAPGAEGARVHRSDLGRVNLYRYRAGGVPFDTRADFIGAPKSHAAIYGHKREFFLVRNPGNYPGIIWQDQKTGQVRLSWIADLKQAAATVNLKGMNGALLAAATADETGHLYYIMIQKPGRQKTTRQVSIFKADARGRPLKSGRLNANKRGLNIVSFAKNSQSTLRHAAGKLGWIVSRTMHKSSDGLNHQGAIAVILDANTLALDKNFGQTSGHSFSNVLTSTDAGDFVGIDLGDNYPRGVHLHRFMPGKRQSKVVFTFKTRHGTSARSPAGRSYPRYAEISRGGKSFYKWSNDNATYSSLGGVIPGREGYSVIFSAESHAGRALDNARTGKNLNDSRNLALVQVVPDFGSIGRGPANVIPDNLMIKPGRAEQGGFFDFGGRWNKQRNTGVVWLTKYRDPKKANAMRVKTAQLRDASIIIFWEKWTDSGYRSTFALRVSEDGKKIKGPTELGPHVRLGWRDDPLVIGDTVYLASGNKTEGKLNLIAFRI